MDPVYFLKLIGEIASVAGSVWGVVSIKLNFMHREQKRISERAEYAHKRIDDHLVSHSKQ